MFDGQAERGELIPLSGDALRLIRDLIRNYCGICFDDTSHFLVQRRLSRRVRIHHLDNFRDYYRLLLYDRKREEEMTAVIDLLTVNETYFFREQNQLRAFSDEIIPALKRVRKNKKIRIWSAGCSTGEEPYTLAMLILERSDLQGWDIEILGSDINQRVLTAARRGVFRQNSFRCTEPYFTTKYFREEDGLFAISDKVKQLVSFCYLNLMDPLRAKFIGQMDIIFCRNVFM